jgi:PAS domain S-box-containing protein
MAAKQASPNARDVLQLVVGGWSEEQSKIDDCLNEAPAGGGTWVILLEELQRSRVALAQSEARYRMLAEQAPVMMHSIDPSGHICSVSDLWLATLGYQRDEVIGRPSTDFLTEASRDHARDVVLPDYMRTGVCRDVPYQFVKRNGEVIDILLSAVAERDAAGEVLRSIAVLVDVTERRRAEVELRFSEARLRALADNSPLVIFMKDLDGRYVVVNREFVRHHGCPETDLVGKTSFDLFPLEEATGYAKHDREVVEKGRAVHREFVNGTADNPQIWSALKFPIVNSTGATIGVGCIESNITEQKRTERALRAAKEQAETANRTKSEFLANMSHELRTPLNAILGFSEIMRAEMFGPMGAQRYVDYAQDIYQSGSLLLELINDILDLSKIEAGRLELHDEIVNIGDLVDGALRFTQERARLNGITIDQAVDPGLPLLRADRRLLTQILLNLLSNATKFTPSGGRISISAAIAETGDLDVRVADTGIGIARTDIDKVLQAFGQVESALSRKNGGTGLGLPLAKGLAELHGGRLDIDSDVGKGTTVTVSMPAQRLQPHQTCSL